MSRESHSYVLAVVTMTQLKTALSPPHFIVSFARGPELSTVQSITELCICVCRWRLRDYKGPIATQALPALRSHTAYLPIRVPVRRMWVLPPLRWVLYPAVETSIPRLRG